MIIKMDDELSEKEIKDFQEHPNKNYKKVILLIFTLIFLLLIGLLFTKLLSKYFDPIKNKLKLFFNEISIELCYLKPKNILENNYEECIPKDSKKVGVYKNIEINFEDPKYGTNTIPIAGQGYKFRFFLKNQNIPSKDYKKYLGNYIYDIKIKKIDVIASSSEIENDDYSLTEDVFAKIATLNKEIIIPADNKVYPQTINFESVPSSCRGFIYFKVILTTEQIGRGRSILLTLPDYEIGQNNIIYENYIDKFSSDLVFSPGPLDILVYSQPNIITSEYADDFSIQINIKNRESGFANISKITLLIQRDYIDIVSCEDSYLNKIDFSYDCKVDDAAKCIKLKINENLLITQKNSYTIDCKAKINKNKYHESEKESFLSSDVSYLYNFKGDTYLKAKNCTRMVQQTTTVNQNQQCTYPDVCFKYSCPNGYSEVSGICNQVDSICCRNYEYLKQSELVSYHPLQGKGVYTSCFGWRTNTYFHSGVDLAIPEGTSIYAINDGVVISTGYQSDGFGNHIIIEHDIGGSKYYSLYAHLKCDGIKVQQGQNIKRGEFIGYSGGSDSCKGYSTGAHLHFELRKDKNYVGNSINPCLYLNSCGPCEVTKETCKIYKEHERINQNSGPCDDPLT
ncbi:MAG: M23 family metallopeptidase [Candidatus Aenigmatarchaeota archaeon]|nr:M23 family metallopeptidase [Candidatus Aenigmarchaeota archaeon]